MKHLNKIINISVFFIASIIFAVTIYNLASTDLNLNFTVLNVLIAVVTFCLLHSIRMIRYYLILSESYIPIFEFSKLYLTTTMVNILIPFKIGELYKLYTFGKKCKSYRIATLSIVTQIFFDLFVISIFLVFTLLSSKSINITILLIFFIFVGIVSMLYLSFPSTYRYLNTFLISKKSKKRDIVFLKLLDEANKIYKLQKDIMNYKGVIILILSIVIWVVEYAVLYSISQLNSMAYSLKMFSDYIGNILFFENTSSNLLLGVYTVIGSGLFVIIYLGLLSVKKERSNSL